MAIFEDWCNKVAEDDSNMSLLIVTEKPGGRAATNKQLLDIVRSHYDRLDRIAEDIAELGYKAAEKILKARLPTTKKARSGDIGEILSTEFAEEEFDFQVPIRRLRYKDGRDNALRGDDFIGIKYNDVDGLHLLKGESKSRLSLANVTIKEARSALNRDNGRCTPISLAFVADRLMNSVNDDAKKLGKILRKEVGTSSLAPSRIAHALVTVTGNHSLNNLRADLKAADSKRTQKSVNIYIPDHADFINLTFEEVAKLGKP